MIKQDYRSIIKRKAVMFKCHVQLRWKYFPFACFSSAHPRRWLLIPMNNHENFFNVRQKKSCSRTSMASSACFKSLPKTHLVFILKTRTKGKEENFYKLECPSVNVKTKQLEQKTTSKNPHWKIRFIDDKTKTERKSNTHTEKSNSH